MTTQLYFWCTILGLLGCAFQTIIKVSSYQKQAKIANIQLSFSEYFKNDWGILALNILTIIVALIAVDELVNYQPKVMVFIKWFFFFIGYTGSSILNMLLSKTQKGIDTVVNFKTDVADGKINNDAVG